ncbi:hypothetical protein ABTK74_19855, partial [Acinetobacter baumannii]
RPGDVEIRPLPPPPAALAERASERMAPGQALAEVEFAPRSAAVPDPDALTDAVRRASGHRLLVRASAAVDGGLPERAQRLAQSRALTV